MPKLRAFALRFFGLFRSRRADDDFAAELDSNVALHTDDGIRSGLSPAEARRQALIRLGGAEQTRQAHRERRTLPAASKIAAAGSALRPAHDGAQSRLHSRCGSHAGHRHRRQHHRFYLDQRRPAASRSAASADPSRLVVLESVTPNGESVPNSYPDFIDFRDRLKLLDGIAVTRPVGIQRRQGRSCRSRLGRTGLRQLLRCARGQARSWPPLPAR